MIAQREEARAARLEALAHQGMADESVEEEREADVYELILQSLQWSPQGSFKMTVEVPTLTSLCINVLVANFEVVEELGDLSEESRRLLLERLAVARKLTPEALRVVLDVALPMNLVIPECSTLSEESLQNLFARYPSNELKAIRLTNCGFGFSDTTAVKAEAVCTAIEVLQLTGMYRISDSSLGRFLGKCTFLRDVDLSACTKVGKDTIDAMVRLQSLSFITLNDIAMLTDEDLVPLLQMNKLEGISLQGLNQITDTFTMAMLERFGSKLRKLNLSACPSLTDVSCLTIAEHCRILDTLDLSFLSFTSTALQQLFQDASDSTKPSIGQLEVISFRGVGRVTDDVVIPLCLAHGQSLRRIDLSSSAITGKSLVAMAKHCPRLEHLDLSFVRGVREDATGALIESANALRNVSVWGCSQFSRRIAEAQTQANFNLQGLLPRETM